MTDKAPDLRDLYPRPKTVAFGTGTIEVTGLSLRSIAALADEYPDLVPIFSDETVPLQTLFLRAPVAALAVFSLVISDEEKVRAFDRLPLGQQIEILGAIFDLTLGGDRVVPFLANLAAQLRGDREMNAAPSPSSSPNSPNSSPQADTAATSAT